MVAFWCWLAGLLAGWLAREPAGWLAGGLAGWFGVNWLSGWLAVTMWRFLDNTNRTVTCLGITIPVFAGGGASHPGERYAKQHNTQGDGVGPHPLVTNVTKISLITTTAVTATNVIHN